MDKAPTAAEKERVQRSRVDEVLSLVEDTIAVQREVRQRIRDANGAGDRLRDALGEVLRSPSS